MEKFDNDNDFDKNKIVEGNKPMHSAQPVSGGVAMPLIFCIAAFILMWYLSTIIN